MTEPRPSRPPLNCAEVVRRLDEFLDKELSPAETAEVREHLDTCVGCVAAYRLEARILGAIKTKLGRIDLPDLLRSRLEQVIDEARRKAG